MSLINSKNMGQLIGAASDAGILNPERSKAPLPTNPILGGQRHNLSYITPIEAQLLRGYGGGVTPDGGQSHFLGIPSFQPGPGAPSAAAAAAAAAVGQGGSSGPQGGGLQDAAKRDMSTYASLAEGMKNDQFAPGTVDQIMANTEGYWSGHLGDPAGESFHGSLSDRVESALGNDARDITIAGLTPEARGDFSHVEGLAPHQSDVTSDADRTIYGAPGTGMAHAVGGLASLATMGNPLMSALSTGMGVLGDISGKPNPLSFGNLGSIVDQVGETFTGSEVGEQEDELPVVVAAKGGEMPKQAQQLANQGRYGDTMLVHMNPREMAGIASLAPNRSISTNPQTGLPEMFDFMDVLPTIAGIGASFFLGPLGAAAVSGLTTAMTTKDIGKGVMAGLMSYGLGSLMGAGSESAAQAATAAGAVDPAAAGTVATDIATAGSGGAYPAFAPGQAGAYGQAVQRGGVILPSPSAAPGVFPPSAMQNWQASGMMPDPTLTKSLPQLTPTSSDAWYNQFGDAIYDRDAFADAHASDWLRDVYDLPVGSEAIPPSASAVPRRTIGGLRPLGATPEVFPNDAKLQQAGINVGAVDSGPERVLPFSSSPPKADGILGGIGEDISDTAEMLTDRTYWDLADTPGYVDDDAARKLGFRSVRDLAGPAMYAGMGAVGTIAPMFEEEYEYPDRIKPTYEPTRQISPSEFRTATVPPPGYDPAVEGEWAYYGNKGGIVNNLPMIYAKRGYGGEQVSDVLAQVVSQQSQSASPSQAKPTPAQPPQPAQQPRQQAMKSPPNIQAHLRSFMPSAYAKEGSAGGTAGALSDRVISDAIEKAKKYGATDEEINGTPTDKLPDLARQYESMAKEGSPNITDETGQRYLPEAIFKQDGGPAGSPVRPEEIMGAEEVATVGIMAGAPDVVQEGVRGEASIMNPTDPQNAEERAIYDKAVLALEGELEPSDAQNAVDEYIEVFGAEAYRSLKKVVDKTRETGGIVKPANGETTVSNGEFQGEDVIAGKIVNPTTGAETANLRVGENEYIKTGKDLAYAAAARGLPPTPENGAMVEGMEEEALRRAFG